MKSRAALTLKRWAPLGLVLALLLSAAFTGSVSASGDPSNPRTYTLDADFAEGTLVNVNYTDVPDQLQLDSEATPFDFIWVAASGRGTIVKINTNTGAILGEYWSAPDGRFRNPSRTTVDGNGNVWTANRDEAVDYSGSTIKIGLVENGQCVDRNGNGVIDTSTGLGDIRPWLNPGGVDDGGGVSSAEDECILLYVRLPGAPNARHVSVDSNNDVWVAGYPSYPTLFYHLDGGTGAVLGTFDASVYGCGGYGGLVDGNGVLWSASISQYALLRYDIAANSGTCLYVGQSYGLGIDHNGYIWNATWCDNLLYKISPAGVTEPGFPVGTGGDCSRGVVVTVDNDVWVANSNSNTVTRLDNGGVLLASVPVGWTPTGVAVDGAGKVWVTDYDSHDAMRIDPATNAVDLTVFLGDGAYPYNYSDMTGSTLIAPPNTGTWTVVHDSGMVDAPWASVSWNSLEPGDSSITVKVASSPDGVTFGPEVPVSNGGMPAVDDGQYLKIIVTFTRSSNGETPVLYDLTVVANQPPDCSGAFPSRGTLWPPLHQWVSIDVLGVTDPDGDPITITITGIRQDEPVDTYGDGRFTPDGRGVGTSTAEVRAERSGTPWVPGNGRFYHIYFTAEDGLGGSCSGEVLVTVPHDMRHSAIDDGPLYDSTVVSP